MIKKLLLTAALLAPALACGQLSFPLNPLPPVAPPAQDPTVPAPAAAAGFTTLALNADFSRPSYANLANWLNNCGGPPPPGWSWLSGPCSNIDVENDSSVGKNVVHLHLATELSGGATQSLAYPYLPFGAQTNAFPVEFYVQATLRFGAAGLTQTTSGPNIGGGYMVVGGGHNHWIEQDFMEVQQNTNSGSGWIYGNGSIEWACATGNGFCNGIYGPPSVGARADMTVYHTFGTLFTGDGVSQYWKCNYIDGAAFGCNQLPLSFASEDFAVHDNFMLWGLGFASQPSSQIDLYIQNIQVWVCPGSFETSTQCHGTVINH